MTLPVFDTSPDIAERLRLRLMARSGSHRAQMAARMFTTARALAAARVRDSGVTDELDARLAVLAQLYGDDLTPAQYSAVRARFDARRANQTRLRG